MVKELLTNKRQIVRYVLMYLEIRLSAKFVLTYPLSRWGVGPLVSCDLLTTYIQHAVQPTNDGHAGVVPADKAFFSSLESRCAIFDVALVEM